MSFVAASVAGRGVLSTARSHLTAVRPETTLALIADEALPYGLDVAGGERLRFSGAQVLVKASAETTGGAFSIVEEISPLDTPRHVHDREDELFLATRSSASAPEGLRSAPVAYPTPSDASSRARDGRSPCAHPRASRASSRARRRRERREDRSRRLRARLGARRRHLVVAARNTRGCRPPQASASAASRALRKRSFSARVP